MQLEMFAAAALFVACSTPTTITSSWKDPAYAAGPMQKILVYGARMSEANRRALEDRYATTLGEHGVQAVASYRIFPNPKTDREIVRRYLRDEGFSGALVSAFERIDEVTTIAAEPVFDSYYNQAIAYDYRVYTDEYVKVETTLWEARDGKLVWSATSSTQNPESSRDAIASVVKKTVSTMIDLGLIAKGPAISLAKPRAID